MIPISKLPGIDRQQQIEQTIREQKDEFNNSSITYAKIGGNPEDPSSFYNPETKLILVYYQKNEYWAYLAGNDGVFPDPAKHDLLWLRLKKVDDIPQNEPIGDEIPELMGTSIAFLIPKIEQESTLDPATSSVFTSGYVRDNEHQQKVIMGRETEAAHLRSGLVFNLSSGDVLLKSSNNSITLAEEGIAIDGKIINQDMEQKGFFEQNPLSFLVPETIVTFPASMKFLPGMNFFEAIGSIASILFSARSLIKALRDL